MRKIKVVEVITDSNIGGAGVLLCTRLKHSDRARIETEVILPQGSALFPRLCALGVVVHEIDVCRDSSFEAIAILKYVALLRRLNPDLIHCHGALSARIAAWLCGVPVRLYTRHCVYPLSKMQKSLLGRCLIGQGQRILSHRMIAVAHSAKQNLCEMGVASDRISVIINGVEALRSVTEEEKEELRKRLGIPKEATIVGICARLEECKGHSCFLAAAEKLLQQDKNYRFLILGDGSLRAKLAKEAEQRGIAPFVIFAGFCQDVAPYFSLMKINVNCSVGTETSSLALSEGMSMGIPAVVSDYGGNPYMVRDGENGIVVPQNDPSALATTILRLREDSVLYEQLSQGARKRFLSELNAEQMTKKTEELYCELFRLKILNTKNGRCDAKINE
ncbi:MAG: glycosyltransferase [Clostridia bacterium]|nr:glycosyltransferase [Clostridia bacterium]